MITVLGTGYFSVAQCVALAELGHEVVGVDVDVAKIEQLSAGCLPFYEPDLQPLLVDHLGTGTVRFSSNPAALEAADVHFVCVGTPHSNTGPADRSSVHAAFGELVGHLRPGSTVVGRSTVPVGTAAQLQRKLSPIGARLVLQPEFSREGKALHDCLHPDRLVFGATDRAGINVALGIHDALIARGTPVIVTDFATAELAMGANSFVATRLVVGFTVEFFGAVDEVNLRRRERTVQLARRACGGTLAGRRIGVLGPAVKPETEGVGDAPASGVVAKLCEAGVRVRAYDPHAVPRAKEGSPEVDYVESPRDACVAADAVLVLSDWPEFDRLDSAGLRTVVGAASVVDARGALDADQWRASGWKVHRLGERYELDDPPDGIRQET
ncbi:MAG TPA: UDP binding domain-containing protein [Jatrophihabitans sp.]|jgi:UDPglucose 6-dehydrogenase